MKGRTILCTTTFGSLQAVASYLFLKSKIIAVVVGLYLIISHSLLSKQPEDYRNEKFHRMLDEPEEILILLWTKYFDASGILSDGTGNIILNGSISEERKVFRHCNKMSSIVYQLTGNRSLLEHSRAVIFHIPDLNLSQMPQSRKMSQRWIFFNLESPTNSRKRRDLFILPKEFEFNWTMTYR